MDYYRSVLRQHAKQRAEQRVGLNLNKKLRSTIVKGIQHGRYVKLPKDTSKHPNRDRYVISDIGRYEFIAVYDCKRAEIVTILPCKEVGGVDRNLRTKFLKNDLWDKKDKSARFTQGLLATYDQLNSGTRVKGLNIDEEDYL